MTSIWVKHRSALCGNIDWLSDSGEQNTHLPSHRGQQVRGILSVVSQRAPVSRHSPPPFSPSITAFINPDQANLSFLKGLRFQFEPDASTPQHSADCTFCAVCFVACRSGPSSTCDLLWSWGDRVKLHWRHMWRNFWGHVSRWWWTMMTLRIVHLCD